MEDYKTVQWIYEYVEGNGLLEGIKKFFGVGANISLPFSEKTCNTPIEELDFSIRSYNCLKRAGIETLGKVAETVQDDALLKIRNLGRNSEAEIRAKVFEYGYFHLSERAKKEFVQSLYNDNKALFRGA